MGSERASGPGGRGMRARLREHVATIKQAPKTAKSVMASIRTMSTASDRKKLVDAFVAAIEPLVGGLDRRGDAFSVGYSAELSALAGALKGSEFLYIRGRDGVPARLVIHRSRGAAARPLVGMATHLYTRVYYGSPEGIRHAGIRRIVDVGAGVGMAGVSVAGFTASTPDGAGVTGSAKSINGFFGMGLPLLQESAVAAVQEKSEHAIDLTPAEEKAIEGAIAAAPDAARTRAMVDRATKDGPVPALVVGANQLAKGAVVLAAERRGGFPFLGLRTGSLAVRAMLPVTLGIDLVSLGTAAASDLRSGDESFARTRQVAGRAVGGTVGAVGGALLALVFGHFFLGGVNKVVRGAGWVAEHVRSPAAMVDALRRGLPAAKTDAVLKAGALIGSAFGALLGDGAGRMLAASPSAGVALGSSRSQASENGEELVDHAQGQAPDAA
ncbi:MAG: hypothetical protein IPK13_21160 [Deltaproteobacteria bacterium]|nr:hypothetical protein [Deltaproteobacteria bacterium]